MSWLQIALVLACADDLSAADHLLRDAGNDRATYEAALKMYQAVPGQPAEVLAREAEAWMRIGDVTTGEDEKLALYKKGQAAADAAVAKDPRCARCWFWRGATLGRWGQTRGVLQSLFILDDVKTAFQKALAANPKSFDARLSLALIDAKVPGFAGGSTERAEKAMREVVKEQPRFTRARLDLAELLLEEGKKDEARSLIQGVLAEKAPLSPGQYRKFDEKRARKLLASAS